MKKPKGGGYEYFCDSNDGTKACGAQARYEVEISGHPGHLCAAHKAIAKRRMGSKLVITNDLSTGDGPESLKSLFRL